MKKFLSLFIIGLFFAGTAHADIFGDDRSHNQKLKASGDHVATVSAPFVDPQTILDYVAAIAGYLGTREGFYYDVDHEDFGNYLASTIYTVPDTGISFSIGMLDTDGVGLTADYNVGALIPAGDVPLLSFTEYLYAFAGGAYRNIDQGDGTKEWELSPIVGAQLKFTF